MQRSGASATAVLADLVPASRSRDLVLVLGGVALTAVLAQVVVPLPFTPVPLTGQTFAVLLVGASLGARRATLSMACYLLLGIAGFPVFAQGASGVGAVVGPTAGYLVGFVPAAALLGAAAARGFDRSVLRALCSFAAASAVIYLLGATWLAASLRVGAAEALALGVIPFLAGDVIKAVLAGLLVPAAWRATGSGERGN